MASIETPTAPTPEFLETSSEADVRLAERHAPILSVSASHFDHAMLRRMIDQSRWKIVAAYNCREALHKVRYVGALVVICEDQLPDGDWKDLLEVARALEEPPFLIVTSGLADEKLWSEVMNLGGFDVLVKPFREEEVRNVLSSVWIQQVRPGRRVSTLRAAS